jgi:histidinol dehydrogenase
MINVIKLPEERTALEGILDKRQIQFDQVEQTVKEILSDVKANGDRAVTEYTQKFDGVWLEDFSVCQKEIQSAVERTDPSLKEYLYAAKTNIERYHMPQLRKSYFIEEKDALLAQIVKPIERAGIYVPGGKAAYPSTVLMNAIPAKIAGVRRLVMITPPRKDGSVKESLLVAAHIAGVDEIYKVGGAQGIGALAFGTESIAKVDKITGPGNIYVNSAKKLVSGYVGIDMLAGPSEIVIIGDESSNPKFVAADLISQAEHDETASAILLTSSRDLGDQVLSQLCSQIERLERKETIKAALADYGAIVITDSLDESLSIANQIAPEHLEIMTEDPFSVYQRVENAGAIFIGQYSPEPIGDYYAGANHTLPTGSTSRFSSPLSVDDFLKKTSLIYYKKEALARAKDAVTAISQEEGLTGHKNAVQVRFDER